LQLLPYTTLFRSQKSSCNRLWNYGFGNCLPLCQYWSGSVAFGYYPERAERGRAQKRLDYRRQNGTKQNCKHKFANCFKIESFAYLSSEICVPNYNGKHNR